ncbi:ATP-dependent zinc metalloprotease FtsH [Clostridium gasigenes]|uniref:ATP-dependent zinc metalloprotease FtsH n=1 Tax=Clostridium gasigenes TaxID=94869 RepID=A0A1H0TCP3_9CLOT|nr:ATP-dependent zinc metalloprotease FtsH [Clostridium gasigenes]MBB6625553.1 ATP-dependent metallopeptidase FtsH/Yme1/Tma family protein [Clostridium gasigenes]MBU3134538.1 ATP-dependent zinc metalloprotease FtsH [Clostridium gasigenes]MBU3138203.1 ATP-dependent zinc metalloprotease FtsH [Clostridium gasigenes]NKF08064.1 ATP-dependent metallopeptidase FtsH/Yme1/Tma family protein [Clostridium gasigenes]QSW20561.1 ATP-dependent zinc metalloprotease FtsH [Clostridium gasigenes]
MKKYSSATVWLIAILILFMSATFLWNNNKMSDKIAYSEFEQKWSDGEIDSLVVQNDNMTITGKYRDAKQFTTYAPVEVLKVLIEKREANDVRIDFEAPSKNNIILTMLPIIMMGILFFGFMFIMKQQSQGGGSKGVMNFGKSKAKVVNPESQKVTFQDVAGADEEKGELEEIVDFLKLPAKYIEMGARIPKGILLVGPPGTGKTLLARAVAGEAGVPFYSISGSDFVEMFVGVGASRVRDLFGEAKKTAPSLIFIDEIDAVGRKRGAGLGGGHDEREQTLNQLLVEMDGFGANEGIIMIAATNRPDILDPALLRPGRFDRQIVVGVPDVKGREEVLKVHTKKKPLAEEVDLHVLAKRTPGFSGADLENVANEAALLAVRNEKKKIGMNEFEDAITRVMVGTEKKSRAINEYDRKLTAYHEAGHAVVMRLLEHSDPVHEISIIPRGLAGGYTMHLPKEDRSYTSKAKLKDDMVGLLGGRVSEKIILSDISTGAKNDIDRVSAISRAMVMHYGMSDKIGSISYGSDNNEVFLGKDLGSSKNFSEEIAAEIDKEVKSFIDEAYNRAETLLRENITKLHAVAGVLLEKEKLDGKEFEAIFDAN